jgi:mRNA interferase RelE/StbE
VNSSHRANYRLIPTREFLKNLERLDIQTNQRIISSIEDLSGNPFLGKPLRGELKGLYSLRIGKYRVIYSVDTKRQEIVLHAAKHRSKVYE